MIMAILRFPEKQGVLLNRFLDLTISRDHKQSAWFSLMWAAGLILLLTLVKSTTMHLPYGKELSYGIVLLYQLYLPLWLIRRSEENPKTYGLHFYWNLEANYQSKLANSSELEKRIFDAKSFSTDLLLAIIVSLMTLPLYAIGYHLIVMWLANKHGYQLSFHLHFSFDVASSLFTNIFLIALPEEVFYRGFLQTRLLRLWPNRANFLGFPLGRAILLTSLLFALGHFAGEYSLTRLAPFFPALMFSMLAYRSRSILGAVIFHGICNSFSVYLANCYFWN